MEVNQESTLSFKHWDEEVVIKRDHSDLTIGEFYQMCRQLALGAGFQPNNVDEYFNNI